MLLGSTPKSQKESAASVMTLASLVGYGHVSRHTRALLEKSRQGRCGQATVDSELARNRQVLSYTA